MLQKKQIFLSICALGMFLAACSQQQPAQVVAAKPTLYKPVPRQASILQSIVPSKAVAANQQSSSAVAKKMNKTGERPNWVWPAKGGVLTKFSAANPSLKGIDIAGSEGAPVCAASDGEVIYSGNSLKGYGNLIIIKHKKNFLTAYAHNRKNMVKEGDRVEVGQRIAEMGKTGTDRVKLHFEVRQDGKPIDPQGVLPIR